MITKNQKVVEEMKKKQLDASMEKSSYQADSSYQEVKEEKKVLPFKEKKKVTKKAKAPKQKKTGFVAWFSGKWKGLFSSGTKESEKIRNISEKKVREQLSLKEQADLADTVQTINSMLTKRKNEGDHEDDIDYIYEDEKSLIEDFKKANPSDKEKDAVKEYTSGNHKDMNGYLRGTKTGVSKPLKEKAKQLEKLTQRSVISKDTAVVRMTYPENLHLILGRSEPYQTVEEAYNELSREAGKTKYVFRDNGICSTSTTPNGSLFFFMLPVEMRILLPKGSHGAFVEHTGLSWHGERELLLAPGTDFQLIGVEKDHRFCDYIADKTDKRNMGNTKLIMYLKVLPKETESTAMNAA